MPDHSPRIALAAAIFLTVLPLARADDSPKAKIEGGVQLDGSYSWTVTNLHNSPITEITFPHYLADQFHTPEGWKHDTKYLANVGVPEKTGYCRATAPSADAGIAPKQKATFGMRIARKRPARGSGIVNIKFADQTQANIAGVAVPVAPAALEAPLMIGGFAGVLLIFILARRRRRKRREEEDEGEETDPVAATRA